jgi:hypothetical protein
MDWHTVWVQELGETDLAELDDGNLAAPVVAGAMAAVPTPPSRRARTMLAVAIKRRELGTERSFRLSEPAYGSGPSLADGLAVLALALVRFRSAVAREWWP